MLLRKTLSLALVFSVLSLDRGTLGPFGRHDQCSKNIVAAIVIDHEICKRGHHSTSSPPSSAQIPLLDGGKSSFVVE